MDYFVIITGNFENLFIRKFTKVPTANCYEIASSCNLNRNIKLKIQAFQGPKPSNLKTFKDDLCFLETSRK